MLKRLREEGFRFGGGERNLYWARLEDVQPNPELLK
jgi:hypothetical protein